MSYQPRVAAFALAALAVAVSASAQTEPPKQKKPSVSVKATPAVAFAPARVIVAADLKGGSDDYEQFYCATVTWDWGDGTESETATDCEPYEPGKSEIRRHFTVEHRYDMAGEYRIVFKLKRGGKVVGTASTIIRVRPGLRDGSEIGLTP
ncbi:MAG TPA: hypothetical protein VK886_09185 [Vicinamibacterales bacterium]|nr:hypothetical protein [Vicinamibacterales bacterium]